MTVAVWRIATDTPAYEAHDLSGKGAELHGGRWNRPGRAAVYAATSIALACLETIVHLNQGGLPLNRFLVRVDVPDDIWEARQVHLAADLPVGWSAIPEGRVSLDTGQHWLDERNAALLLVPSVIVPEELNVLINVAHPETVRIKGIKVRPWLYDTRVRFA